jgi:hypothetical protein
MSEYLPLWGRPPGLPSRAALGGGSLRVAADLQGRAI